jgi:hypothetical protein
LFGSFSFRTGVESHLSSVGLGFLTPRLTFATMRSRLAVLAFGTTTPDAFGDVHSEQVSVDQIISLSAGLARLTDSLDRPGADLEGELRRLSDELASVIDSYLGLSITITGTAGPVTMSTWHDAAGRAAVGSSLLIPLPLICATPPGSALILHASQAGAFVDLAADLSYALGEPLPTFVLDQHLAEQPDHSSRPELIGLAEASQINQAIGVLLACGRTREQALAELWRRASDVPCDLRTAAEAIISRAKLGVGPRPF